MSAATAEPTPRARRPRQPQPPAWTRHTVDDLTPAGRTPEGLHFFTAPSASAPGRVNTVTYDPATRTATCDCRAAEVGKYTCWHQVWAERAYLNALARTVAAGLSDEELVLAGRQAAARVEQADQFWAAFSAIDRPMLDACHAEWTPRSRTWPCCASSGAAPSPTSTALTCPPPPDLDRGAGRYPWVTPGHPPPPGEKLFAFTSRRRNAVSINLEHVRAAYHPALLARRHPAPPPTGDPAPAA